jgi:hypothetical protein
MEAAIQKNPQKLVKGIKDKEIQLVKEFKSILERFPLDFANAIFSQFIIIAVSEEGKNNFYNLIQLNLEDRSFDEDKWRIDLSIKWLTDKYTDIFFEFKIDDESLDQINKYQIAIEKQKSKTNSLSRPLIVSICRKKSLDKAKRKGDIITITWEEFAKGISKVLGFDAIQRLGFVNNENDDNDFSPEFPKRRLGEPLESLLEDFLRKINDQKLIESRKDRVMVVTGKKATQSSQSANITWFGKNWDSSFEYIVVVYQKKLQYAGKVIKIYQPEDYNISEGNIDDLNIKIDDQVGLINKTLEKLNLNKNEENDFRNSPVAQMTKIIFSHESWGNIIDEPVYRKPGAITQSHRYFDSPADFVKHFTSK